MLKISDAQRRARLVVRHGLTPATRFASVEEAIRGTVALHATDPATIVLQAWARVGGFEAADLEHALYERRTVLKHMAMRRTLFVVTKEQLPTVQAAASERVAAAERGRISRDVVKAGLHEDGEAWLARAEADVLAALADGRIATAKELRAELPSLEGVIAYGAGKSWGGDVPFAPRVLTALSAAGLILRAANEGTWASSRPRWGSMEVWLGEPLRAPSFAEGTADLVSQWLRAFGPGTSTDIKWWLGSTVAAVKGALATLGAVSVELENGEQGWVLPDDIDEVEVPEPSAALLPGLDLTTMGWKSRDWYLGAHGPLIFDSVGNGGPTAWWDGRIVGGWRPVDGGGVELQLLEDPGPAARRALEAEAARLAEWRADVKLPIRFPSPLSKAP